MAVEGGARPSSGQFPLVLISPGRRRFRKKEIKRIRGRRISFPVGESRHLIGIWRGAPAETVTNDESPRAACSSDLSKVTYLVIIPATRYRTAPFQGSRQKETKKKTRVVGKVGNFLRHLRSREPCRPGDTLTHTRTYTHTHTAYTHPCVLVCIPVPLPFARPSQGQGHGHTTGQQASGDVRTS